jgi:hypothetical protein
MILLVLSGHAVYAQHPDASNLMNFVTCHVWPITGLPRSYLVDSQTYWQGAYSNAAVEKLSYEEALYDPGRQQERFIIQYGINLYDAACYQIAASLSAEQKRLQAANYHTRRLLTNRTLAWSLGSRGHTKMHQGAPVFEYGDAHRWLPEENALFFRTLCELYTDYDPLLYSLIGAAAPQVIWSDWKPVVGENAWCDYIGPLQAAWLGWGGRIGWTDAAMKLASDVLPAIEALQSPIGAVYHVPSGVYGKSPNEISNENNFSLYAGLRMFRRILNDLRIRGENLIRNGGFEEAGRQGSHDALHWRWGGPDCHASSWGNFSREQWAAHGGAGLGAIRGSWNGGTNYGGFWQEWPTRAGLTNLVSGWFKQDDGWTSSRQEWKLEFYNGDYYLLSALTNVLSGLGADWQLRTMSATAPAGAVFARLVILAEGVGNVGALQCDDLTALARPLTLDVTGVLARVTTVMTNQEHYFQHYLLNTKDGVLHTGGVYHPDTCTFEPYVFSNRWIGGPYRGFNTFSGSIPSYPSGYGYRGTNYFDGYSTVRVTLFITNSTDQVSIRHPAGEGNPEYAMTKLNNNLFTYTFTDKPAGTVLSFDVHPAYQWFGPAHTWTVQATEPAAPYTSRCTHLFAVDCQTWGLAVLGAPQVDAWYGENASFNIWQNTRRYGGYFIGGDTNTIRGVGFSDINNISNQIASAEWTFGAILMCRNLARDYRDMGRPDLAQSLTRDAETMRAGIEALKVSVSNLTTTTTSPDSGAVFTYDPNWSDWGSPASTTYHQGSAYLYSNRRYEIPFGWWANPLPSLASTTWAIMTDHDFDPFVLGGRDTNQTARLIPSVQVQSGPNGTLTITGSGLTPGTSYILEHAPIPAPFTNAGIVVEASFLTTLTWSNLPPSSGACWFRLRANP